MNFRSSMKLVSMMLVVMLLLPIIENYAMTNTVQANVPVIIEVDEDNVVVTDTNGMIVGIMQKGAKVIARSIGDGQVVIQWNGGIAKLQQEKVVESTDVDASQLNLVKESTNKLGEIKTSVNTPVYKDELKSDVLLTIEKDITYEVKDETNDFYTIHIGDRVGYLEKENVIFSQISEEVIEPQQNPLASGNGKSELQSLLTTKKEKSMFNTLADAQQLSEMSISVKQEFKSSDMYFEPTERLPIYDNSTGKLVLVGYLEKNQVYQRVSDYGDWHKIKYGNGFGFVWKENTKPATTSSIKNLNKGQLNSSRIFKATSILAVYDNSTGALVQFATLNKDVSYPIIKEDGDWYVIDVAGRLGHVYKPATKAEFTLEDQYFQPTERLPIYDNSTGKLVLVGYLEKDQVYQRVSDYGDWHKIMYGNGFGFVWKESSVPTSGNNLKNLNPGLSPSTVTFKAKSILAVYDNSSGGLVQFATLNLGVSYPIIKENGDWYVIDIAGRLGHVYKPATVLRDFVASDKYFTTTEKVIIYDNSSGKLKSVGYLDKGQSYMRVSDYGDWHKIKFGNGFGFVWKESSVPTPGNNLENLNPGLSPSTVTFKAKSILAVYDNSSGGLVQFATLNLGVSYPIIKQNGDWYVIDIAGRLGHVYKPATVLRDFVASDKYFTTTEKVIIYDNSSGGLKSVGYLDKGQTYMRVSDYGDWHKIKYGNESGFVWKESTEPTIENPIRNQNPGHSNTFMTFKTKSIVGVFDNSSGELVQFAALDKDVKYPIISEKGDWFIIDIAGRLGHVYKPATAFGLKGKTIVVDAGHGGKDSGTVGTTYRVYEKNVNLETSKLLADYLRKAGANVVMTRSTDVFIELRDRVTVSHAAKADAFVSVHSNSSPGSPNTRGIETFYYNTVKDKALADNVQRQLLAHTGLKNRSVKFGNLHVLRENKNPSILIELGFLTNSTEEKLLGSYSFQNTAATAIYKGLENYFYAAN